MSKQLLFSQLTIELVIIASDGFNANIQINEYLFCLKLQLDIILFSSKE